MSALLVSGILLIAGLAGLAAACVSDFKERLIYNEIVLFVLATGVALRLSSTPELLWAGLLAAAIVLVVLGQISRLGVIGGGDAKLIAASMLLVRMTRDANLLANIAIAGGALSCVYLVLRTALRRGLFCAAPAVSGRECALTGEFANIAAGAPMPYALAILGGAVITIGSEVLQCVSATSCSL
jgi:prepilin peptidase CpaA